MYQNASSSRRLDEAATPGMGARFQALCGGFLWIALGLGVWLSASLAWADTKVTIVPFVPVQGKVSAASTIPQVSKKLGKLLKNRGFSVRAAQKGEGKSAFKLPNKEAFDKAMLAYQAGKNLMRKKKYEPAKNKLEEALRGIEQSMAHLRDFSEILDLYRLLGLCFFRLGLGEQGEQAISRLGALAPTRKYSVSKMPPAMRRVLRGAQKRALRGKGKLRVSFPSGSDVQFNGKQLSSASSPLVLARLAPGRHYLWVRKEGFLPFAEPVVVKGGRITNLQIKLRPIPKAGGPDFSAQIARIHGPLRQKLVNGTVRSNVSTIARGLGVELVLFGYFQKIPGKNQLSLFVYRKSDGALKAYPPIGFDLELLEVDIKLISVADALSKKLKSVDSLPSKSWDQKAVTVVTPRPAPAARPVPTARPVPAARPTPRPAVRPGALAADDPSLDGVDDTPSSSGGIKVVQPRARPVARPAPRPAPAARPQPAVRKVVVKTAPAGDDDIDDIDSADTAPIRRTPPRPAPVARREEPRPAPVARREEPRPAPVARREEPRPASARPRPASVVTPRPAPRAVASDTPSRSTAPTPPPARSDRRRRVARGATNGMERRQGRRRGPFDPDRDVDWSNPIPRVARDDAYRRRVMASRRERMETPSPAPSVVTPPPARRKAPAMTDDDEPPPRRRVVEPPPRRRATSWDDGPSVTPPARRKPPSGSTPVTQKWWFWTAIAGGVVVAGGVTAAAVIAATPANSYDVFVNINPPQ